MRAFVDGRSKGGFCKHKIQVSEKNKLICLSFGRSDFTSLCAFNQLEINRESETSLSTVLKV